MDASHWPVCLPEGSVTCAPWVVVSLQMGSKQMFAGISDWYDGLCRVALVRDERKKVKGTG